MRVYLTILFLIAAPVSVIAQGLELKLDDPTQFGSLKNASDGPSQFNLPTNPLEPATPLQFDTINNTKSNGQTKSDFQFNLDNQVFQDALPSNNQSDSMQITDIQSVYNLILQVLNGVVPILVAGALLYFLYGVMEYISSAGYAAKHAEGLRMMLYGIIGLFVMISVFGLVNLFSRTFSFSNNSGIRVPKLNNIR